MIDPLINHLWQSTVCALAAALLTLAFRENGAKVRFLIWLAASAKFLIPFSLLVRVGEYLRWDTAPGLPGDSGLSILMSQIAQPAAVMTSDFAGASSGSAPSPWNWNPWRIVLSIWLAGSTALLCFRLLQWHRLSAIVKASSPLHINASIPVRETVSTFEPGIFGIFSPTLLMPAGIVSHLAPAQLDAILAHELCHWRRRDNLTAALHMLVEVLFWFHPLVWWLGGRLVVERERACDESVIQSGRDRETYAEGILKVCQHYVELPSCAAGVSGGLLRMRIEDIMTSPILSKLSMAKRCLLSLTAFLAIAAPIALGMTGGAGAALTVTTNAVETKHYRNEEWKFELDIPKQWNELPPESNNGPQVSRFRSPDSASGVIIWRAPNYSRHTLKSFSDSIQRVLAKDGNSNFVSGESSIGSERVVTLDFDRPVPDGNVWSCRYYFVTAGAHIYTLGFGTISRDAMLDTFDRAAKSFAFENLEIGRSTRQRLFTLTFQSLESDATATNRVVNYCQSWRVRIQSHALVEVPEHEECLLLRAVFPDQPFAVPAVLNIRERTSRRTEVCEYPRRGTAPLRYSLEHGKGLPIQILLIFLAEARETIGVEPLQCIGAELADDNRLLISERPGDLRQLVGQTVIPADVLVEAQQVRVRT